MQSPLLDNLFYNDKQTLIGRRPRCDLHMFSRLEVSNPQTQTEVSGMLSANHQRDVYLAKHTETTCARGGACLSLQ